MDFPEPIVSAPAPPPISNTMQQIMELHGQELAYADDPDLMPIDKLLDKRVKRRRTEYLVRWDDMTESWEPAKNITADAIEAYEKSIV
jgi:hypothetical protein